MIRRAACIALRKFSSSPPPAPSPVTGGVLGLSIKAGISTDIIAPGTGGCYTFAHMLGELSFRPQLSSIVREMISDLGDDVVDSMLSGACFGSLDPSMLTVSGNRLMIARTYCSAPMQLSLLQQYRGLLLYYSAVNVGEHAYEDDSFLSEIHKIRTVSDIVFIVMHPRLHFANKSVKFITSAVLMLQYANIRFQHVHYNVIHRRVSWGKAFQCFHVGQIDLPALINGIENQAMRDSLLEGIKYFNGQAPDLGGLRVNSPTIAATVFHNYYKHLFTSRVIHNVGDSCAVVHDLLPQIPTYLWEFIKFLHTKSLFPLLDLKMLVKLRQVQFTDMVFVDCSAERKPGAPLYDLFVSGFQKDMTCQMLIDHFSRFGGVARVFIPEKQFLNVKAHSFYGFVAFHDKDSAIVAIQATDNLWLNERRLSVIPVNNDPYGLEEVLAFGITIFLNVWCMRFITNKNIQYLLVAQIAR